MKKLNILLIAFVIFSLFGFSFNYLNNQNNFQQKNAEFQKYKGVYATDSTGIQIKSYFRNQERDKFRTIVEDFNVVYQVSIDSFSTIPNWKTEGNQDFAAYGFYVSDAGDVNGDGYSDVIVCAYKYDNGETDEGKVYVYHGSSSGLSTTPNWTAESNQANAYFGHSVSTAGDVNGDGYSDVIVGAPRYSNGESNEGRVYIYFGSSSGLSVTPNWTGESNQPGAYFGNSVSNAGDVNGDGYSDIIIGAFYYDIEQVEKGKVFVYHGSSSGLSAIANWTMEGTQLNEEFGKSVSTAGDVNGDGYSDVIIGADGYDNEQENEGGAFVYHGSASGLSSTSGWSAESNWTGAYFGNSVSTAGDVNGDGFDDVIVSACSYTHNWTIEGKAYVYYGSLSGLSSIANWTAEGNQVYAHYGWSVSTAGDINNDGYSDVIVSSILYDNGEHDEGRAFIYHGSSSGLSPSENCTIESNQANANLGESVSTAGDVNNDGYSDIIVGVLRYDNVETDEGAVIVYHGSVSGISEFPSPVQTAPANNSYGISLTPTLIWDSVSYATGYKIKISTDTAFSNIIDSSTVVTTQYSIPSGKLSIGTKYYWKVAGYNPVRIGHWSSAWSFRTLQNLTLNLKVYLEGFWNGETQISDTIKVYLVNDRFGTPPFGFADSCRVLPSTNGTGILNFTKCPNYNYHIVVFHRNHLETWSRLPQSFVKDVPVNFNFTTSITQAYGSNMIFSNGAWCIFGGDINQDGFVDGADMALLDNDLFNYASGYTVTDVNGDQFVDGADMAILDNNLYNYIGVVRPGSKDNERKSTILKSRQEQSKTIWDIKEKPNKVIRK